MIVRPSHKETHGSESGRGVKYRPAEGSQQTASKLREAGVGSGKQRKIDGHRLRQHSRLLLRLLLWIRLRTGAVICHLLRRIPEGRGGLPARGEIGSVSAMAPAR